MWPFDDLLAGLNFMFEYLYALLLCAAYLPAVIINTVYACFIDEINLLITVLNSFSDTVNLITDGFLGIFADVWFSSIIGWALAANLTIVLIFRLHQLLKNVSVAGFSV